MSGVNINITVGDGPIGEGQTTPIILPEDTSEERRINVVFTGHRAIHGNYPRDYTSVTSDHVWGVVGQALWKFGEWLRKKGYGPKDVRFVNGGAVGFDLVALYMLVMPWQKAGARYTLALPWPGYWNDKWNKVPHIAHQIQAAYDAADDYLYAQEVDDGRWAQALNERNKVMVRQLKDNDVLMACWSGSMRGGTWNCLNYAREARQSMFSGGAFRILTVNPVTGKWGELK